MYLLIICPPTEAGVWRQLSAAIALLCMLSGRNLACEWLFDAALAVDWEQMHCVGPTVENALHFPSPDISYVATDAVREATARIGGLSKNRRAQVALSLQWFDQALPGSGPGAWLKYWIALESLAMSGPVDRKSLIASLAHLQPRRRRGAAAVRHAELYDSRFHIVHEQLGLAAQWYAENVLNPLASPCRNAWRLPCRNAVHNVACPFARRASTTDIWRREWGTEWSTADDAAGGNENAGRYESV